MDIDDFGSGLVICLAKFHSHFWSNDDIGIIVSLIHLKEKGYLDNDYVEKHQISFTQREKTAFYFYKTYDRPYEEVISHLVHLWANGASDHLYEIHVPSVFVGTPIEKMINDLRTIALDMGHNYDTDKLFTYDDIKNLKTLTDTLFVKIDKYFFAQSDKKVSLGSYD